MLCVTELITGGTLFAPRSIWVQHWCLSLLSLLCYFSPGGAEMREPSRTHALTNDSANNPRRFTVFLKVIHISVEVCHQVFSSQLLHNSDQEHLLSFNSVDFAGKADLFEVHTLSLRDVDISLAVPSPSVLPEYCWSSGHLSKTWVLELREF